MGRTLNRWFKVIVMTGLVAVALLLALNVDRLATYRAHFRGALPATELRLNELSVAMDSTAVKQHFQGLDFRCHHQPSSLGDVYCYADVSRVDGLSALLVVTHFRQDHLTHVVVQMPWWAHGRWLDKLLAENGRFTTAGLASRFGGPVLRWPVPNGQLEFNRDRSFNPLEWSALFWSGRPRPPAVIVTP